MSAEFFAVYDPATGRILRTGACAEEDIDSQAADGEAVLVTTDGIDPAETCIVDGATAARPACPVSGSATGRVITLLGLPFGCKIYVSGSSAGTVVADGVDGAVQITVPAAGTYMLRADPFPGLPYLQTFAIA